MMLRASASASIVIWRRASARIETSLSMIQNCDRSRLRVFAIVRFTLVLFHFLHFDLDRVFAEFERDLDAIPRVMRAFVLLHECHRLLFEIRFLGVERDATVANVGIRLGDLLEFLDRTVFDQMWLAWTHETDPFSRGTASTRVSPSMNGASCSTSARSVSPKNITIARSAGKPAWLSDETCSAWPSTRRVMFSRDRPRSNTRRL